MQANFESASGDSVHPYPVFLTGVDVLLFEIIFSGEVGVNPV